MIDSTTGMILAVVVVGGVAYYGLKKAKDNRNAVENIGNPVSYTKGMKLLKDPFKKGKVENKDLNLDKNYGILTRTAHFV